MPVRIVTSGGEPVREVTHGGDPVRIVTEGVSDPVRGISAAPPTPPSSDCLVVESATCLLCLQADALVLNDGDPVSVWADASGQGNHFTQTGDARPTYRASKDGFPAIEFDGLNVVNWMLGPDFADNLSSFTVFHVAAMAELINSTFIITKVNDDSVDFGWAFNVGALFLLDAEQVGALIVNHGSGVPASRQFVVRTSEVINFSEAHYYINGDCRDESGAETFVGSGTITQTGLIASGANTKFLKEVNALDHIDSIGGAINSFCDTPASDTEMTMITNAEVPVGVGYTITPRATASYGTVLSCSNSEPVRLGVTGIGIDGWASLSGWIRAVMIYAPAPNASDRAAIEAWLAAKYGITLP